MSFKKFCLTLICISICSISCDSYLLTPFTNACDGVGIEYAKKYNPNEKNHKIILYEKGKNLRDDWNSKLPHEYQGDYADCDLVGCIEKGLETIETCSYNSTGTGTQISGTRTRKYKKVTITILEARSGLPLYSNSFTGGTPDVCPQKIFDSNNKDIIGTDVEYEQIANWLLGYLKN